MGWAVYVGGGYAYLYALDAQSGEEKWKYPWSTYWGLTACPTVSEGVVYIGSYQGDTRSVGAYLTALDAATGEEMWRFQASDEIESSPAVSDGVVYFGSYDGYLYAVDAESGQLKWKFQATGDGEGPTYVNSSPAVADGVVYFSDWNGYLYVLNAQTGQQIWSFAPTDVSDSSSCSSPAVAGGVVYVANTGTEPNLYGPDFYYGYLHALDAKTGQEKWMYKAEGPIRSCPAVSSEVVYFLYDDYGGPSPGPSDSSVLVAMDVTTGEELWQFLAPNDYGWGMEVRSSPAISGEVVYFGAASGDGCLYALDAMTGEELWAWVTDREGNYLASSSPAISDGVVYFSGNDGYLYALR